MYKDGIDLDSVNGHTIIFLIKYYGLWRKSLDHYENPRNVGKMDVEDSSVGTGMVGAPACGDVMRLQIKVNDDGIIEDTKFKTTDVGRPLHQTSLTEWLKKVLMRRLKQKSLQKSLLTAVKIYCLAEDAIKAAIMKRKVSNS